MLEEAFSKRLETYMSKREPTTVVMEKCLSLGTARYSDEAM